MQAIGRASERRGGAETLWALVQADGSAGHAYPRADQLSQGPEAVRNLADAAHYLCVLHGRVPGVVDYALAKAADEESRDWLARSADAFTVERGLLTRLAVATGPLPSTPGQAECEAAVLQQRHALEMLAQSDRNGCALGAAVALTLDWVAIRCVLEVAARRVSIEPPACVLPSGDETSAMLARVAGAPAVERALSFGAQQLLAQHRGLWDLLEARQAARARL